ncbi:MFS general substrate transporter [Trematosphaeria pertusa]|uniref:MFS general substrate transporter n=1 Tax=Trematosphaeria pertusa TaxID=390896 RepID=A0A6A6IT82_9PLEO|nr:MFS general substrate transporter [Trematosphaeria pertusa]KAF2253606.1 MFS general substrate transporter [Trematosphaeria pertusa]
MSEAKSPKAVSSPPCEEVSHRAQKPWHFWAVFPALCLCSFLTAFDASVVFTALPTIVSDLQSGELYIWIINAYTLSMTALQPLYGQIADIWGRKVTLVLALSAFLVGSLVCGLAKSTVMLVVGRAVQGMGGGGLSILPGMILCDLIPLRERQKYTSIVYGAFAVGTLIGPVAGGSLAESIGWRWIFYLVLIIGAVSLVLVLAFLRLKHGREGTLQSQLRRIDILGTVTLTASISSILICLTWADAKYPWASWRCIVPLVCGFVGLAIFVLLQANQRLCPQPTVPLHLFKSSTSLLAFLVTLLHGLILYWSSICIPLYFQAVLLTTPKQSGINSIPMAVTLVPAGILGGFLIAKFGRYKPNQISGFVIMLIAQGCFSMLGPSSSTASWAGFQILMAIGAGVVLTALLPAIQAPLSEEDTAASSAMWGFVQSFGFIWGAAIPSAIFNSRSRSLAQETSIMEVKTLLKDGSAYEHGVRAFLITLSPSARDEAIRILSQSVRFTWMVSLAFTGCGFLLACSIREIPLRTELETKYGLRDKAAIEA